MLNFFLESPVYIAIVGLIATVICLVAWINSAHKAALWATVASVIVTLILLVVEQSVVTYQEEIVGQLHEVADHLANNRRDQAIASIHPAAIQTIQQAKAELPKYEFSEARVTAIHRIEIDGEAKKPRAVARFNVFVALSVSGQTYRIPRFVEVTLYREDGRWYVYHYRHAEPTAGLRN